MKVSLNLTFNGCAEEAATLYASVLGGKIENLHRYGDCTPDVPENWKNKIMHLCLIFGENAISICDAEPQTSATFGTGHVITIDCDSEEQIKTIYDTLSQGGQIRCPLQPTFFAKQYADFVDRYGVAWALLIIK